jgi:hypothetical protein
MDRGWGWGVRKIFRYEACYEYISLVTRDVVWKCVERHAEVSYEQEISLLGRPRFMCYEKIIGQFYPSASRHTCR